MSHRLAFGHGVICMFSIFCIRNNLQCHVIIKFHMYYKTEKNKKYGKNPNKWGTISKLFSILCFLSNTY